jgi:hypothetical protein
VKRLRTAGSSASLQDGIIRAEGVELPENPCHYSGSRGERQIVVVEVYAPGSQLVPDPARYAPLHIRCLLWAQPCMTGMVASVHVLPAVL